MEIGLYQQKQSMNGLLQTVIKKYMKVNGATIKKLAKPKKEIFLFGEKKAKVQEIWAIPESSKMKMLSYIAL